MHVHKDCPFCICEGHRNNSLREALSECIAMLRRAAVWPADDIQGLRYHVYEAANRATATISTADEAERS